jgi:hypothetical protein
MRILSILPALATVFVSSTLAAQEIRPLPEMLTPGAALAVPAEMKPIEVGAITGMVVGATVGGLYGAFVAKECGVESDCTLSRGVKTVTFVAIGGGLGGLIGLGTSFLLSWRAPQPEYAPLRIAPTTDGGMSIGVSLRH